MVQLLRNFLHPHQLREAQQCGGFISAGKIKDRLSILIMARLPEFVKGKFVAMVEAFFLNPFHCQQKRPPYGGLIVYLGLIFVYDPKDRTRKSKDFPTD